MGVGPGWSSLSLSLSLPPVEKLSEGRGSSPGWGWDAKPAGLSLALDQAMRYNPTPRPD